MTTLLTITKRKDKKAETVWFAFKIDFTMNRYLMWLQAKCWRPSMYRYSNFWNKTKIISTSFFLLQQMSVKSIYKLFTKIVIISQGKRLLNKLTNERFFCNDSRRLNITRSGFFIPGQRLRRTARWRGLPQRRRRDCKTSTWSRSHSSRSDWGSRSWSYPEKKRTFWWNL